nr:type I restriction enzyme endonuclease domain-containing protein [Agarivorans sp. B2Z047]
MATRVEMLIETLKAHSEKKFTARDLAKEFVLRYPKALAKAYSLCSTMDETHGYKNEIAFYSAIKAAFIKHSTVDKNALMKKEIQH